MENVPAILKSRRFWSSVVGLLFLILVQAIPSLAPHAETLSNAILLVIALLVGGYSLEDALLANKDATTVNAQKFGRK